MSALGLLPGMASGNPGRRSLRLACPGLRYAAHSGLKKIEIGWPQRYETASYLSAIHAWHSVQLGRIKALIYKVSARSLHIGPKAHGGVADTGFACRLFCELSSVQPFRVKLAVPRCSFNHDAPSNPAPLRTQSMLIHAVEIEMFELHVSTKCLA